MNYATTELDPKAIMKDLIEALALMTCICEPVEDKTHSHYTAFRFVGTGARFYISTQQKAPGKITIGVDMPNEWRKEGSWPLAYDDKNQQMSRPSITMSATKSPEAQARDFVNRLLTDGIAYYNACKKYHEREHNFEKLTRDTMTAIAEARGKGLDEYELRTKEVKLGDIGKSADANVSGARIDMKIRNLNVNQVKQIMEIMKQ